VNNELKITDAFGFFEEGIIVENIKLVAVISRGQHKKTLKRGF